MSMLRYTLRDFIAIVPSYVQTQPIAMALEIFSQGQCDRLVILNQQQSPVGMLQLRHLMPLFIQPSGCSISLDWQQPLSTLEANWIEPIVPLSADLNVEQFKLHLHSQSAATTSGCNWALVDSEGKFLGLLDTSQLWKFLALSPTSPKQQPEPSSGRSYQLESPGLDLLVQLLEKLPLPLMLQTSNGEVVTQNPAWCHHFGALSDSEAVQEEIAAILKDSFAVAAEINQGKSKQDITEIVDLLINCSQEPVRVESSQHSSEQTAHSLNRLVQQSDCTNHSAIELDTTKPLLDLVASSAVPAASQTPYQPIVAENSTAASSYCQLGHQPGTCVCVLDEQNGQKRVWQFVKILLPMSFGSRQLKNETIWLLWANDVTQQQQLATELVAKNADLIHLNRLKDEFLSCISHELKTPLTAVLGLSTLLKDQTLGQLNERQARYARLIHESGRHLMSVVNDILDLTRMETGQMELTLAPVQIKKVCDRAVEQARTMQSKGGEQQTEESLVHHFTLLIEPGLESLIADELRLRQMLVHLLSNAFKFTETSGEIGLHVNRWEGWITFTVWDTGIGIPEHQQHLIFQKFQQLENPLTRQFEGTGLGLVLTRTLARLHGGDVSFLSKAGKGSQFTLLLPPHPPADFRLAIADAQTSETSDSATAKNSVNQLKFQPLVGVHPRGSRRHRETLVSSPETGKRPHQNPQLHHRLVLVVEATPRFIENFTEQLTSLGYWVVVARSGTEALEKARRLQPGAILLNPLLPLLSGWDVLTLLKSDTATQQIPVIVTATIAEKQQALTNRADEFLSLPVQPQALQQVLAHFCTQASISCTHKGVARTVDQPQLTILRLLAAQPSSLTSHPSPHRILEADDLEQAALLARIWQPDVALLDGAVLEPLDYLQQLVQYPSLAALPLVTLDQAIAQAANQIPELAVFPCIIPTEDLAIDALLSVLQIAAGMSWQHSVLVVDAAILLDLASEKPTAHSLRCEWFQALIQYLHMAGLTGVMVRSGEEVRQQIQQQSVSLILICIGESRLATQVGSLITDLSQQYHLPPVLVLDQRSSQGEVREQFPHHLADREVSPSMTYFHTSAGSTLSTQTEHSTVATAQAEPSESLATSLGALATEILPPCLSMEELLEHIHQALGCLARS